MNETFFTSDSHFGHKNIIKFCDRPYTSVEEMNEAMIEQWNSTVAHKSDTVFHCGDFSFANANDSTNILRRLRGQIHLMWGNHDGHLRKHKPFVELLNSAQDVKEVKLPIDGLDGKPQRAFFSHYAHRVWNHSHHGSWHFYGHSHGTLPDDPNALSMEVGVDGNNMQLVSIDDARVHMAKKLWTPIDHHGRAEHD